MHGTCVTGRYGTTCPVLDSACSTFPVLDQRFSSTTRSLIADLRWIIAPEYSARAAEIASQLSKPAESVAAAADLVENFVRLKQVR